jgi:uncharacterized membrane protein
MQTWLIWGFITVACWGCGTIFLKPTRNLDALVIQTLIGIAYVLFSLIGQIIVSNGDITPLWKVLRESNNLYVLGYVIGMTLGTFTYLYAAVLPGSSISILTAMTWVISPVITAVLAFAFFKEYENVDLRLTIPGIILIMAGGTLLALSPKAK